MRPLLMAICPRRFRLKGSELIRRNLASVSQGVAREASLGASGGP
jgi:hypothetical protein